MIHKIKKDFLKKFKDNSRLVNLKSFKNFKLEVRKYFGINKGLTKIFFRMLGFSFLGIINKFSFNFINLLEQHLRKNFIIGDFYKRKVEFSIQRFLTLKTYRGFRFKYKLPANGQRTRVNSRTSRKFLFVFSNNKFSKDIFILKEIYSKKLVALGFASKKNNI